MSSYAAANSSACISAGTCKPLGGYSVWSAVPPLETTAAAAAASDRRPIILVLAQIDNIEMFHDSVQVGWMSGYCCRNSADGVASSCCLLAAILLESWLWNAVSVAGAAVTLHF